MSVRMFRNPGPTGKSADSSRGGRRPGPEGNELNRESNSFSEDTPFAVGVRFGRTGNGEPVLVRYDRGKISRLYKHRDTFLHSRLTWEQIRRVHPTENLPPDPAPVSSVEAVLEGKAAPSYPHGYIIEHISPETRRIVVQPVILVESALLGPAADGPGKQPRWTAISLGSEVWQIGEVNQRLIDQELNRSFQGTMKFISATVTATQFTLELFGGGPVSRLGKEALEEAAEAQLKKVPRQLATKLRKVAAQLTGPVAKATLAMLMELGKQLWKSNALREHREKQLANPNEIHILGLTSQSAAYRQAAAHAAAKFASTFLTELLNEAASKKNREDLRLLRAIQQSFGKSTIKQVLDGSFDKALRDWAFQALVTNNVTMILDAVSSAAIEAKNETEFVAMLRSNLEIGLANTLKANIQGAFKVAGAGQH